MLGLSYAALRACRIRGIRNGNWRLLDVVQRGFYRACLAYTRLRETIVNPKMVSLIGELVEKLTSTARIRALKAAVEEVDRVTSIYSRAGVFKWAPQVKAWLQDEVYMFWLGVTRLNSPTPQKIETQ